MNQYGTFGNLWNLSAWLGTATGNSAASMKQAQMLWNQRSAMKVEYADYSVRVDPPAAKASPNQAWLNRRVDEIRVKL